MYDDYEVNLSSVPVKTWKCPEKSIRRGKSCVVSLIVKNLNVYANRHFKQAQLITNLNVYTIVMCIQVCMIKVEWEKGAFIHKRREAKNIELYNSMANWCKDTTQKNFKCYQYLIIVSGFTIFEQRKSKFGVQRTLAGCNWRPNWDERLNSAFFSWMEVI